MSLRVAAGVWLCVFAVEAASSAGQDDPPLGPADYTAYLEALKPPPGSVEKPAELVSFRDLWDRPAEYRGRRVAVAGRVERVFHQGPLGRFPALAEIWIVADSGDPLCIAFAETPAQRAPRPGDLARFEGTFLRLIRYRGGDVDRAQGRGRGPFDRRQRCPRRRGAVRGRVSRRLRPDRRSVRRRGIARTQAVAARLASPRADVR
jgi:hypothetical protein